MDPAGESSQFNIDELVHPGTPRDLRMLPRLLANALRLVWRAARKELAVTIALQAVGSLALAAELLVARDLLRRLIDGTTTHDYSAATPEVIEFVVLLAIAGLVSVLRTELARLLAELVAWFSMREVIGAANAAELSSFENPAFHDRLQRSIVNATIRPIQMTTGLIAVGTSLFAVGAVSVTLVVIEPLFLPLGIAAVIPITLASLRVGRALYRFAVAMTPTDRERAYVQSLLTEKDPAKEIRAYDLGGYLEQRFDRLYSLRIQALRNVVRSRMRQGVTGSLLTALVSGGTLALLIVLVSSKHVSLAGAGTAAAALLLLGTQLQALAAGVGQLYESALFVADFDSFVTPLRAMGAASASGTDPPERTAADSAPVDVELRGVEFTYPSREEPSLCDVSIRVPAGKVVALVGENGSGKTTLAKLVAGLYPIGSGQITWNGVDVTSLPPGSQRRRTAVLFQDFVRYFFAASENIAFGDWTHADDKDAIVRAAQNAGADPIVRSLPRSYETFLGPQFFGGSDLSGGQWQRIALARAFFRDAGLIILDEPTAALDPRAEAALFDSVRRLFAGRSVLLISHRFASVRKADWIYVLDGGRVIEEGTHYELLLRDGVYAELFTLQASAFGLPPA